MEAGLGSQPISSDFVRKLYKMLESPSDESVVRWGNDGNTFVVLENEKFTKSILPQHFKHSNFASFVRQLNKYDFHKVRHNNEETGGLPYGPSAWEFRHPDFKMNNKNALENIRRKAPAHRKQAPVAEDVFVPSHQIDMMSGQVIATQQQVTALQDRNNELTIQCSALTQEVMTMKNFLYNHEQVLSMVVNAVLNDYGKRRRQSRTNSLYPGSTSEVSNPMSMSTTTSHHDGLSQALDEEAPPSPLLQASKLLSETNVDTLMNNRALDLHGSLLQSPHMDHQGDPSIDGIANSVNSPNLFNLREFESSVYPAGGNNGIDPMFSDHLHNIPYSLPVTGAMDSPLATVVPIQQQRSSVSTHELAHWKRSPRILLVEDDAMCRKIGSKFLEKFRCSVTTAADGVEAVNKAQADAQFDLILMDIVMPNLDGISACHIIRQQSEVHIPIVAMTTNIKMEQITMYYQHGMSDILAKPFTKEGLLQLLEKHLPHLKKSSSVEEDSETSSSMTQTLSSPNATHTPSTTTWTSADSPNLAQSQQHSATSEVFPSSVLGSGGPVLDHGLAPGSRRNLTQQTLQQTSLLSKAPLASQKLPTSPLLPSTAAQQQQQQGYLVPQLSSMYQQQQSQPPPQNLRSHKMRLPPLPSSVPSPPLFNATQPLSPRSTQASLLSATSATLSPRSMEFGQIPLAGQRRTLDMMDGNDMETKHVLGASSSGGKRHQTRTSYGNSSAGGSGRQR